MRTEDWEPRRRLANRYGLTRETLEDLLWHHPLGDKAAIGEISAEEQWHNVARLLKVPLGELPAFREQFFAGDRLDRELIDYIRSLKPAYRVGMISNAFSDLRPLIENELHIADVFDEIVISAEEGVMKPDPKIYLRALERLGIQPEAAVFVDDFERNIHGAREVGMLAIHFRQPDQTLEALTQLLAAHGANHR